MKKIISSITTTAALSHEPPSVIAIAIAIASSVAGASPHVIDDYDYGILSKTRTDIITLMRAPPPSFQSSR
ncbi:uncharacterized protein BO72DRAFT_454108 [Aspergillus fijiensis CBS 313.89]|uniref:Uncharacterized protein n=1 Tax=Aspergillus fijiensis CBS 313.89 TaxID=1448319 RepID=A0A8G1VS75_9EURO|nr:uncharacterized protein BO72DRAFT_454108 [Aspergillus fijiensis CBS 313.89]RAK70950.1 hypothetical protein BO72DRAFT_454108 [Aspergillus fijiensis CBS 313.89]